MSIIYFFLIFLGWSLQPIQCHTSCSVYRLCQIDEWDGILVLHVQLEYSTAHVLMAQTAMDLIEVSVFYVDPENAGKYKGIKERKHVHVPTSLHELKETIFTVCGIKEEAYKRGLGRNVDITVGRIDKTNITKVFSITTEEGWNIKKEFLTKDCDAGLRGK